MSLVRTIPERRPAASRTRVAEPGVVAVTAGETPIPRTAILQRAKRKAGRIQRYLTMASGYRTAKRQGSLPRPVFIVCQNRTGSTFLNQLFGAHPQCWTYREGSHQEAMRHEDCPHWLSGQPFSKRWRIRSCSWIERFQTRVWLAGLSGPYPFGVFKVPHALTKVLALQRIVPEARFVLLVRHPAAQISSAVAKNNRPSQLRVTADALSRFLVEERPQVTHLTMIRYEELVASPVEQLTRLCQSLGMEADRAIIERCVQRVGVRPGRGPTSMPVPGEMRPRARNLCKLLGYDPAVLD